MRGPKLNTILEVQPHQCWYRGMITALLLLATLVLTQARMPLAFLATWAHCWLMFSHLSTNTSSFFFLPGSFPDALTQACIISWGCCDWSAGPNTWSCLISYNWPWPISPVCPDHSASYSRADQHSHPTSCHLQTSWGSTQSPHPELW